MSEPLAQGGVRKPPERTRWEVAASVANALWGFGGGSEPERVSATAVDAFDWSSGESDRVGLTIEMDVERGHNRCVWTAIVPSRPNVVAAGRGWPTTGSPLASRYSKRRREIGENHGDTGNHTVSGIVRHRGPSISFSTTPAFRTSLRSRSFRPNAGMPSSQSTSRLRSMRKGGAARDAPPRRRPRAAALALPLV